MSLSELENIYKGKKVLVTGHTGFKGSWLCLLLNKLGAQVYGYSLLPPTIPSLFEIASVEKVLSKSFISDIRDYPGLLNAIQEIQPEFIIHMAAQPLVLESYKNPIETYSVNVMGTVNLLEAVRHVDSVKVVLNVTTDKCYENREWIWGYRENESMGGYDPYSNSKSCSELITSSFRSSFFNPKEFGIKHNVALASARAGNVIGGGDWAADRLIPDFIRAMIKGDKVRIRNPYAIRPWQHVLEPLTGYLMLCAKLHEEGVKYAEGWNFGPDDSDARNVEWIIDKICSFWGNDASFEIDSLSQLHEANYLKLDCTKAKNLLGWYPRWNILQTLESIVEWVKAYQSNKNMRQVCGQQIDTYFQKIN